ncbi:MAG: efflux RND transporter periplasmic adaptor subunit [Deltaproteobacteria bacterium]|nr:efflux RND transporter periplasmic adaptor subunit [Deltaproteobacteria bacterium]
MRRRYEEDKTKMSAQNSVAVRQKSSQSRARTVLAVVLIGLLIVSLLSCKKEKKAEPERLVNVRTWTAEIKRVQPYLETTGTLKADEEVVVSSEVDGIIKKLFVEEGSPVGVGSLLIQINETDYMLDWKRSDAQLRQAQASLANAQAEYKRKSALYQDELITKQQFDDISTRVTLAEAELERAKATLAISRERLARTKIYSPLPGAVKEKKVSVGDYVRNGMPLLQLIRINPLKLNFTVSEKDVAGLKIGQEVAFTVDAFPGKQFQGKVSLLYPHVEERTRTLQAEAIVPNADHVLKPGYFARVQIFTQAARDVVVAPITALMYDGSTIRVFVVNSNKAKERVIKTGNKYGEYVEVTEGLKEKEEIVVVGQNNLSEGVKVHVAR